MKNLIIILVTVLFVTSCTPPPPDTSSLDAGMEMFNKNKEIADKTFDLFIAKDLEGMLNMYSDELIWSPANTTDSLSKAAFEEGMKDWMTEFEVFSFDNRQYYPGVDDDFVPNGSVRIYGTWFGTHNSGAQTVSKYYAVLDFNDEGKIVTDLEWFDVGGVFDQVESQMEK
jgi:ketosteroid isomerase-like protein|tara:strand:+ start:331 stop:840 length:510 start_codon:yes stop_codon:yes gene_type:complete